MKGKFVFIGVLFIFMIGCGIKATPELVTEEKDGLYIITDIDHDPGNVIVLPDAREDKWSAERAEGEDKVIDIPSFVMGIGLDQALSDDVVLIDYGEENIINKVRVRKEYVTEFKEEDGFYVMTMDYERLKKEWLE